MPSATELKAACSLPTLRSGSQGDDVILLQKILNSYGYSVKIDGIFGKATEAAVKQFQKSHNLTPDGIVGPKTWNALLPENPRSFPTLRRGSTGYYVELLQEILAIKVDGIFGKLTEDAVKQFQINYGLKVDGIVGPNTWEALYSMFN